MKGKSTRGGRQEHWLSHLERAQAQNTSLAQYSRAHGLNVQSLYNARHELSSKHQKSVETAWSKQARAASRFVAVEVGSIPVSTAGSGCRIQVGNVVIECASLPEADWLSALCRGVGHAVS